MFRSLFSSPKPSGQYSQTLSLDIDGEAVEISIRHNERARRYSLRVAQTGNTPVLTIPKHGTFKQAREFAQSHRKWLGERLVNRKDNIKFEPGVTIPLRGENHILEASGRIRGTVMVRYIDEPTLIVPGDEQVFARRLTDWLKQQARQDLQVACARHAENLGLRYNSITVRDQRTRWGSCSSTGRLNFSWRLILAPAEILDYVAAHEVAHLEEMNHQPQFWALVEKTCPDMNKHRKWLKSKGGMLHSYGR